jgi:hypothetical protein
MSINVSRYLILLGIIFNLKVIRAQQILSQPQIDRMISAYTYYVVQNITLETLSVKYPQIKSHAVDAINEWDKNFLSSIQNIDHLLTDTLKDKWLTEKENIIHKYGGTDFSSVTEKEAIKYFDMVYKRALGNMQSPILETLIIYKPEYLNTPENEFSDGYTKTFSTNGINKNNGIKIKLTYPTSWLLNTSNTDNIIKGEFTCYYGLGNVSFFLNLEDRRTEFAKNTINQLLSEKYLKQQISQTDSFLFYSNKPQIDNLPTGTVTFIKKDADYYKIIEQYNSYYKNFHIQLQFEYKSRQGIDSVYNLKNKYSNLNKRIISNIILLNQWEIKRF